MNEAMLARNLDLVVRACRDVERGHADPPSLDNLASGAGLSRFHFHRLFKKVTRITPHAYLASTRARRVRAELLRATTVADAIYEAGFNSNGRFYEAAPDILGMTPTSFRTGGKGELIQYCFGHGEDGVTLVALASKGICDVVVADDPNAAVYRVRATFPHAEFFPGSGACTQRAYQAILSVGPSTVCPKLPPDIRETVLDFLIRDSFRKVPYQGTTPHAAAVGT
jgi:AraC family transcriptional regulator of adaptative response/methylated-DNA-[protein]-cysteine methyltransferase